MRTTIPATLVAALCTAGAWAAPPEPPKGVEGGKSIFRTLCASCHGVDARGGGPVAQTLKTKPPNLRQISRGNGGTFPKDEVARRVDGRDPMPAHGTKEMPVWGDNLATAVPDKMERERRIATAIDMVIQYLETIQE